MDASIVKYLSKKGYYSLVFRGDVLEILNIDEVKR
jgi:hypothetical protein